MTKYIIIGVIVAGLIGGGIGYWKHLQKYKKLYQIEKQKTASLESELERERKEKKELEKINAIFRKKIIKIQSASDSDSANIINDFFKLPNRQGSNNTSQVNNP